MRTYGQDVQTWPDGRAQIHQPYILTRALDVIRGYIAENGGLG